MSNESGPEEFKTGIKNTFNTIASGYDNPSQRYFPFTADYMITLADPRPGDKVLDVATGTGLVAIAAAQAINPGGRVQAIDFAQQMLDKAEFNVKKHALLNVDFHEMDAEQLEFKSSYFDLITCSFGVFFFTDPDTAVKNWQRVLKPGGKVILSTFAKDAFQPLMKQFRDDIESMGVNFPETSWTRFFEPELCKTFLEDAGYQDVQVTTKQMGHHLSSEQDWWEIIWNSGLRGIVEMLPNDRVGEFRLTHLEHITELKTEDGIWLDVEVIFSQGTKS